MNLRRRAATFLDELALHLGRLADRLDPPSPYGDVPDGYYVREDPDRGEVLLPIDRSEPSSRPTLVERSTLAELNSRPYLRAALERAVRDDLQRRARRLLDQARRPGHRTWITTERPR